MSAHTSDVTAARIAAIDLLAEEFRGTFPASLINPGYRHADTEETSHA